MYKMIQICIFFLPAKSCGDPRDILNGRHEGSCHYYGCNITYRCQPGFELIGQAAHYCQSDGTWTPRDLPTCVRKCYTIYRLYSLQ